MNCQECPDYIDAYIDNELDIATAILVKQHLRDCIPCQQLLEARKMVGALLDDPHVQFEVPDSLLGKIHSVLPPSRTRGPTTFWQKGGHSLVLRSLSDGGNNRHDAWLGFPVSKVDL